MKIKAMKKPVVIEAVQWTGDNFDEIEEFCGKIDNGRGILLPVVYFNYKGFEKESLMVRTLECNHRTAVGDYIIKGVRGECYPCKKDIFEETYDIVKE